MPPFLLQLYNNTLTLHCQTLVRQNY